MDEIKAQKKALKKSLQKGKAQERSGVEDPDDPVCGRYGHFRAFVRACRKVRQHHGGPLRR